MSRNCAECKLEKTYMRSGKFKNGHRYVDDTGRIWVGRCCPDCSNIRARRWRHLYGVSSPIDSVTYPKIKKGRDGERRVAEFLRENGATDVELTTSQGPDVTYTFCGERMTGEVKTVTAKNGKYFSVSPVSKNRRGDNFVFIVMPNNHIWIENMFSHLLQCGRDYSRQVTRLVHQCCPELFERKEIFHVY